MNLHSYTVLLFAFLLSPRLRVRFCFLVLLSLFGSCPARADQPVASYIFPTGGQRGKTVQVRVGGLYLNRKCHFEMAGPGIEVPEQIARMPSTIWFEGPIIPLPDSQQAEDYPKDMAGWVRIARDASLGPRRWRLATSQGATAALQFMVGDLPEIQEEEVDGSPIPRTIELPVTVNGRIFPREDVDIWTFPARKGQTITCEVHAARLGSPLDSRLEVLDPSGRRVAENDDAFGADSFLRFTASTDGSYQVRIHDISFRGGPAFVYRLTMTADPYVDHVYPLGGKRGSTIHLDLAGQGVPEGGVDLRLPKDAGKDLVHRITVGSRQTNPFLLELDDLPEFLEAEPNDDLKHANAATVPGILNGRIGKPGDVDTWSIQARKGEAIECDLRAARLGSTLDGKLTVVDSQGKEVATSTTPGDPVLNFNAPADGTYFIQVRDRFSIRGGSAHSYRVHLTRPRERAPDFELQLGSDAVTLYRGAESRLKILVQRLGGFTDAIDLAVDGLPTGVTVEGNRIPANQSAADLIFKAKPAAKIENAHLTIKGSAQIAGKNITQIATLPVPRGENEVKTIFMAVSIPTPFKVKGVPDMRWVARGSVVRRRYTLERGGYDGPLDVHLADRQARHLQGVTAGSVSVPAGATEFEYAILLAPWMEMGRTSRTCVTAVGVIKEADGSEHEVSFTSNNNAEQVVAVIKPGRLAVEVQPASCTAEPGKALRIAVHIARVSDLVGPVKVELLVPPHIRGLRAEPVTVPASADQGNLTIHVAGEGAAHINMPLLIRAILMDHGDPVVAETKLDIQSAQR